jgi:hypothetical protein
MTVASTSVKGTSIQGPAMKLINDNFKSDANWMIAGIQSLASTSGGLK